MRYSYGIMDQRKILLYNPQLFLKGKDLLIFPSKDFKKWHSEIKEYIDALYQINHREIQKNQSINITDLNLAIGVLHNITEELENLFDPEKTPNFSYHYISHLDDTYKKSSSPYSSDMRRCDIRIPVINQELKYHHLKELLDKVSRDFQNPPPAQKQLISRRNKKKH